MNKFLMITVALLMSHHSWALDITDDRGVKVQLPAAPVKIAAVSTFAADVLSEFGITPIAASTFGKAPTPTYLTPEIAKITSLGLRAQTNFEILSQLRPDATIAIRRYTEEKATQFEAIAPYFAFDVITYEDSLRMVSQVSKLLFQAEKGAKLNSDFEQAIKLRAEKIKGKKLTAAMLVSSGEVPYVYYDQFMPVSIMNRLGVKNVAGENPLAPASLPLGYRMPLEELLEKDPDILILFNSTKPRGYVKNPVWPHLKAVKNNQVYVVGQHFKEGAGPIARQYILEQLSHIIDPENFPKPDVPTQIAVTKFK